MHTLTSALALSAIAFSAVALTACSGDGQDGSDIQAQEAFSGPAEDGAHHRSQGDVEAGKLLFDQPLPGTNGRSCATCHVADDHFALSPKHVADLYQTNPSDPLFNALDADDPAATPLTFNHLKAGLVRVTLTLADNLDVIDADGNVITNAARTITVWRAVPTIENTAYTAPYQFDDRAATLEIQADAALHAHSQIDHEPSAKDLDRIADFESTVFSDPNAQAIADAIEDGYTPPDLLPKFPPGSDGAAGEVLFKTICAQCHGSPTLTRDANKTLHDELFPVVRSDGTIATSEQLANGFFVAAKINHNMGKHHDLNIGIAFGTELGQVGLAPNLQGVDFPHYRIRFYTDASRKKQVVDLPPAPPGVSPSLGLQSFSVDPGRAIITGDYNDFEAFAVPQLRGIANTAPYFHDNNGPDLSIVLDFYSEFIIPSFPALNRPLIYPPEGPGLPPESMTPTEKAQVIAFLQKL